MFLESPAGRLREIIFRQGCKSRRKYLSAWPLGDLLCSGGLNPLSGFYFPLFSMVFPWEIYIRVAICGKEWNQNCSFFCPQSTYKLSTCCDHWLLSTGI